MVLSFAEGANGETRGPHENQNLNHCFLPTIDCPVQELGWDIPNGKTVLRLLMFMLDSDCLLIIVNASRGPLFLSARIADQGKEICVVCDKVTLLLLRWRWWHWHTRKGCKKRQIQKLHNKRHYYAIVIWLHKSA